MKIHPILLLLTLIFSASVLSAQAGYTMPDTQVLPINDRVNKRQYELYIKLPEGYFDQANKNKRYPVIYYTDAVWHIEALSSATAYIMPETILVGISWQLDLQHKQSSQDPYFSRYRDYTFSPAKKLEVQAKYDFGQAKIHLRFIEQEVFNLVETRFRIQADNRTYFSYSLGAQLGIYALLTEPNLFKSYILGSPAIRNSTEFLSKFNLSQDSQTKVNVLVTYGSLEQDRSAHVKSFIKLLEQKKHDRLKLTVKEFEGTHQSAFPATAVGSVTWLQHLQTED